MEYDHARAEHAEQEEDEAQILVCGPTYAWNTLILLGLALYAPVEVLAQAAHRPLDVREALRAIL